MWPVPTERRKHQNFNGTLSADSFGATVAVGAGAFLVFCLLIGGLANVQRSSSKEAELLKAKSAAQQTTAPRPDLAGDAAPGDAPLEPIPTR